MYLNHEYFAPWIVRRLLPGPGLRGQNVIWNLAGVMILIGLSAGLAFLTFCAVEWPFLSLRARLLSSRVRVKALSATA